MASEALGLMIDRHCRQSEGSTLGGAPGCEAACGQRRSHVHVRAAHASYHNSCVLPQRRACRVWDVIGRLLGCPVGASEGSRGGLCGRLVSMPGEDSSRRPTTTLAARRREQRGARRCSRSTHPTLAIGCNEACDRVQRCP